VIPPEDWRWDHDAWRRFLRLKSRIRDGEVQPESMRAELQSVRTSVTDQDVIDALYEEHLTGWSATDIAAESEGWSTVSGELDEQLLPDQVEPLARDALRELTDGERSAAVELLDGAYSTACATREPERIATGAGHRTVCHLYDDTEPGTPGETGEQALTGRGVEGREDD